MIRSSDWGPTPFPVASALYRDLGWDHVVDCYPSPQVVFSLKRLEESEDFEEKTTSSKSEVEHVENNISWTSIW
jgi:hypothetical protein